METSKKILFLFIFLLIFAQETFSQQRDSLRYGILLDKAMIDAVQLKDNFINAVDISPNKFITLSTNNRMYVLGWMGIKPLGSEITGTISSFCYTKDSVLMFVLNNDLCTLDAAGKPVTMFKLPNQNMGLSAGGEVIYFFDRKRNDDKKEFGIYALAKGGKYKKLFVSPLPITAVIEMNKFLFVSIGSAVYSYNPLNNEMKLVSGLQKDFEIISMTADYLNDVLYFATQEGIFAWKDEKVSYVTGDFGGGILKYFDNGLLIFNPSTNDIMRITGISGKISF
jgi:hypothetical protein